MCQTQYLFTYFRPFSQYDDTYSTKFEYKKHRWFAWNSNPGPQDGSQQTNPLSYMVTPINFEENLKFAKTSRENVSRTAKTTTYLNIF